MPERQDGHNSDFKGNQYINHSTDLKEFSEQRTQRAELILQKGSPELVDEFTYLVPSQFDGAKKYRVIHLDGYSCECPDFEQHCRGNGLYCKHIKAIMLFQKVKTSCDVSEAKQEVSLIADVVQNDCCPYCQSQELIKRGVRKTELEEKQRHSCKACDKRFVLSPIKKIKGNAKLVCLAMDCYYKGLSYRDISDQFKQFYGLSISHVSIREWVLKFGTIMDKYSKTLTPETSGKWNADETMIRTKKARQDYEYLWNVMDNETKFILASVNSGKGRSSQDAQAVMTEALAQNKVNPSEIVTDRLASYQDGIRRTFRNWGKERKVKHTSILGQRQVVNNNAIENLHTHQKEFHKVRRGVNEVQDYADGFRVFHNFIRKGVADKRTPAERAKIGMSGNNRWETLLLKSLKEVPNLTGEVQNTKSP